MRLSLYLGALILTACQPVSGEIPAGSIVSNSLCADSYLLSLPEVEPRIGALSWQSRSELSRAADHLRQLPQLDANLERLAALDNVTLIGEPGTDSGDIRLRYGETFEAVWENFATLSAALDTPDPSPDLRARLDNLPKTDASPRLLYLNRAGMTAGPGTFVDAVFKAVGARNAVTTPGWHTPDVEQILTLSPDAVVTSFLRSNYHGAADMAVRHAALEKQIADWPRIDIAGALWPCAGPGLVEAAEHLSAELAAL